MKPLTNPEPEKLALRGARTAGQRQARAEGQIALAEDPCEAGAASRPQLHRGDPVLISDRFRIGIRQHAVRDPTFRFCGGCSITLRCRSRRRQPLVMAALLRVAIERALIERQIIRVRRRDQLEHLLAEFALQLCEALVDAARGPRHVLARLEHAKVREPRLDQPFQRYERRIERLYRPDKRQPVEGAQRPRQLRIAVFRFGHRETVGLEIAAGAVARDFQPGSEIPREIVLPGQADADRIGPLLALEQIGRFQPVERVSDEQNREDFGIRNFRRRQEQGVRRQCRDVRIGDEEFAGRLDT